MVATPSENSTTSSPQPGTPSDLRSRTYMAYAHMAPPEILESCGSCPASLFYKTTLELRCFCKALQLHSYGPAVRPVIQCDAREMMLAMLRAR